jgi:hypothetical protein
MYGAEYNSNFWAANSVNEDVPCALCRITQTTTSFDKDEILANHRSFMSKACKLIYFLLYISVISVGIRRPPVFLQFPFSLKLHIQIGFQCGKTLFYLLLCQIYYTWYFQWTLLFECRLIVTECCCFKPADSFLYYIYKKETHKVTCLFISVIWNRHGHECSCIWKWSGNFIKKCRDFLGRDILGTTFF